MSGGWRFRILRKKPHQGRIKLTVLLKSHEPSPLEVVNRDGNSDYFLICEHAGRRIPEALGDLGLPEAELGRHIAWDIGARAIAMEIASRLDAPLYMQRYSRLVCDCNRKPDVDSFIPKISETTEIPGNLALTPQQIAARTDEIYWPFHNAVAQALDARKQAGKPTFLITIHSFTPVFREVARPWQIGILYNRDPHFSKAFLHYLRENTAYEVGDNQPYSVGDETDYAIPVHGEARNLPCVEIEIRNDLTQDVDHWADLIIRAAEFARRETTLRQG